MISLILFYYSANNLKSLTNKYIIQTIYMRYLIFN